MESVSELIGADVIALRVHELAAEIVRTRDEDEGDDLLVLVLLKGAFVFAADLLRALDQAGAVPQVDFLTASSYGTSTTSSGQVRLGTEPATTVEDRDVLLVDDIVDTGRSLTAVRMWLETRGAGRVRTCVLLDKPSRREVAVTADFTGFEVPDRFIVGYGLDCAEKYRHLPYVGVLTP